jgi:hypothetical protein
MYRDKFGRATNVTHATAVELAELTGRLRQRAAQLAGEGDQRAAATIISETLALIEMPSMAEPIKRLRKLLGPDAQPQQRDAI